MTDSPVISHTDQTGRTGGGCRIEKHGILYRIEPFRNVPDKINEIDVGRGSAIRIGRYFENNESHLKITVRDLIVVYISIRFTLHEPKCEAAKGENVAGVGPLLKNVI